MKKIIVGAFLLTLLVACQGVNSSNTSSVSSSNGSSSSVQEKYQEISQTKFDELKGNIRNTIQVYENYNNQKSEFIIETAIKDKEFSVIQYNDLDKTKIVFHECYLGQDDEYIYSTRLNVNNEINYYKTFNPYTSEFYKWSDGYQNLFSFVNLSDFDKNEQNIYTLSKDVINEKKLSNYISVLLYGNPGFEFETFNLFLDDDVFNISATSIPFEGSITYEYSFKGTISYGDDINVDYKAVPFEEKDDPLFDEMINTLKSHNYTATALNLYEGEEELPSTFYSNGDAVYYEFGVENSGFYVDENNLVQEVRKVNGEYQKVSSPMEGSLDEVRPSFKLSSACFDKKDNVYTLKSGVDGDVFAFYILQTTVSELDEFSIEINEDNYVFKNVSGEDSTTITFSKLGSTIVECNKDYFA